MQSNNYKYGICGITCFCDAMTTKRPNNQTTQMAEEPVYFEDEELDAYRGLAADASTPEAVEEFREVMTTMRPDEVPQWLHSLQLRGIELPLQIIQTTKRPND